MRSFIWPAVWLGIGLFGVFSRWRMGTTSFLEARSEEALASLQRLFEGRLGLLLTGALALLSVFGTVQSIWAGAPSWWLWLLATGALIGSMYAHERTAARLREFMGEERGGVDGP